MPKKMRTNKDLTPRECDLLTSNAKFTEQGKINFPGYRNFLFSSTEIQEWHTDFLRDYPSGKLEKQTFIDFYKKFHPQDEENITDLFNRIDVNEDGTIDFNELLVLIAMRNQSGNLEQRLAFVFDLWDESEDGQIDRKELTNLISAMYERAGVIEKKGEWNPKKRAKQIIAQLDITGDKKLSKQEFVTGCMKNPGICSLLLPRR